MQKGFTLIELIVVVAIIAVLSAIILFSIAQYIGKGKDSSVYGNLAVLIPAGETYYNASGDTYDGYCDPLGSGTVLKNAILQMPQQKTGAPCYNSTITSTTNPAGVCCYVKSDGSAWASCAREFSNTNMAYCVDSRGMKEEIAISDCPAYVASNFKCP